jgi:uncharacterized protein (TIGR03437 family)
VQNETGAFQPVPASATFDGIAVAQLPVMNGNATATWEVLESGLQFDFGIWVQSGTVGGTANFAASLAPAPPAFDAVSGGAASATLPIPRFVSDPTSVPLFNTNACAVTASTSTALTLAPTGIPNQYTLIANVTTPSPATSGVPAGTVTFYDNGAPLLGGLATLNSAGTASFVTSLPVGSHRISAAFTPANALLFAPSTSPENLISIGGRSNSSLELACGTNPSLPGQAVTFTALVTGGSASGIVQFSDGAQSLGTVAMTGGRASVTTTFATAGVHQIVANYSGDAGNIGSSALMVQTVQRATGSLSLGTSTDSAAVGQMVTFTATLVSAVPSGVTAATGTVQFVEGGAVLGTASLTARTASLVLSTLAPGTHQIQAIYTGDANWYGLHSPPVTTTVTREVPILVLNSSATLSEMQLTAAISVTTNGGSVQFFDTQTNAAIGTAQVANSKATLSLSAAAAAKIAGHAISAVYSGSELLAPGSSNTVVLPGVRNAAGGNCPEFAADEMVTLFGSKLAESTDASGLTMTIADATGAAFPGAMSNVSATQVNFLMPGGLARGPALVALTRGGTVVAAVPINIGRVAPGLFAASQLVHGEGGQAHLVLYGTGIRNRSASEAVLCNINGASFPVAYAGAQGDFAGLDQVNVLLPADLGAGSKLNVSLTVDGQESNLITVAMP